MVLYYKTYVSNENFNVYFELSKIKNKLSEEMGSLG